MADITPSQLAAMRSLDYWAWNDVITIAREEVPRAGRDRLVTMEERIVLAALAHAYVVGHRRGIDEAAQNAGDIQRVARAYWKGRAYAQQGRV